MLDDGTEVAARRAILADTSAAALLLDMLDEREVPGWVRAFMKRFPQGWGTFKVDWALSGPVPWQVEAARESAVVHAAEDVDDLARFTREVRAGKLPERPYLVIGQQTLSDPTRAPAGKHTLYCYTHVPRRIDGGWAASREGFADRVEARIEELAPGFRASILGGTSWRRPISRPGTRTCAAAIWVAARTPGTASSSSGRCSPTSGTACR